MFGIDNYTSYVKDAFHRYLINGETAAIQPQNRGTKVAGYYPVTLGSGETFAIRCRLSNDGQQLGAKAFDKFDNVFAERIKEANHFYSNVLPGISSIFIDQSALCSGLQSEAKNGLERSEL